MLGPRQQYNNLFSIRLDRLSSMDSNNLQDMVLLLQNQGNSIQIHKKTEHLMAKMCLYYYSTYQSDKASSQLTHLIRYLDYNNRFHKELQNHFLMGTSSQLDSLKMVEQKWLMDNKIQRGIML